MKPRASLLALALLAVCQSGRSDIILTANLTNDQEPSTPVPVIPTTTNGLLRPVSFGTATFVLNDAMTAMTFTATIFNIDVTGTQTTDTNDNLGAAHIHAGANNPPLNNPVVWGFFGMPLNDINPNDASLVPFSSGVGGTFSGKWDATEGNNTTLAAQLPNIFAGRGYINFHTTQFSGGEIRGQIVTAPDGGSTALLLGAGLVLVLGIRRRIVR